LDKRKEPLGKLLWEELVTPGHVLAAQLRWIEPYLLALGIAFIIIGAAARIAFFALLPPLDWDDPVAGAVRYERAPATAALAGLPSLSLRPEDKAASPPDTEIEQVIAASITQLNRNDHLPENLLIVEVTPEDFWRKRWPIRTLVVTSGPSIKLIAAIVVLTNENAAGAALRWLGVFRKVGNRWTFASLAAPGFGVLDRYPVVRVTDIPVTLAPVLPPAQGNGP
jgi:hypothetical protein